MWRLMKRILKDIFYLTTILLVMCGVYYIGYYVGLYKAKNDAVTLFRSTAWVEIASDSERIYLFKGSRLIDESTFTLLEVRWMRDPIRTIAHIGIDSLIIDYPIEGQSPLYRIMLPQDFTSKVLETADSRDIEVWLHI